MTVNANISIREVLVELAVPTKPPSAGQFAPWHSEVSEILNHMHI